MPALDLPFLGNAVLGLVLVAASYTFAMAVGAGRGRPQLLPAARLGTYATVAFTFFAVVLLAYAFQTHDFRIRYVARYSDRSMSVGYLFASLWGGQDGSLLFWTFLLAGYTAAVTRWLRGRYVVLQPWILATLMSIFLFFVVLMLFSSNPFETYRIGAPTEGEGLNPLLQNYWMAIHPPALYMGFVGWSVPWAFLMAALITGRLDDEWIKAARPWAMIAWTFLSLGLLLGCVWSYEELGWGGYWAWDPVENASFMPWLVATAYLHSAVVQERYGMLKMWNVFLLQLTYFMTIFGTTLTRSGLISSVHSFAKSDIGIYFFSYLAILAVVMIGSTFWRARKLKSDDRMESALSREFFFLMNNWVLLGMMFFVLGATTWPLLSEWLYEEEATVGPGFYNRWMVPLGVGLLFLTGVGPLIAWRKATGKNLARAFIVPTSAAVVMGAVHLALGGSIDMPAIIDAEMLESQVEATGRAGRTYRFVLAIMNGLREAAPLMVSMMTVFVIVSIGQEFWRGASVRMRSKDEDPLTALGTLVSRAKRRYGGYIVHVGVALMYFGFAGAAYDEPAEQTVYPGEVIEVAGQRLRYDQPQMTNDPTKRAVFAHMTLLDASGAPVGTISPAKFIYRSHPEMPTTEVAIRSSPVQDVYVILSTVDPETRRATLRVIIRPLVMWIWIGGIILLLGSIVALWPNVKELNALEERRSRKVVIRPSTATALVILLGLGLSALPIAWESARAQDYAAVEERVESLRGALAEPAIPNPFARFETEVSP